MERKLPRKSFRKFGDTSRGCPALLGNLGKCCSTRYWKLPKFKSYFLVELKAPFNFFCILSLQQLTETEKKNWGKIKKQYNSQHVLCSIFRFLFYICYISTGIHAKWTYLHVLSQTSFFFSCYDVLTTRLKVHIWLTHMKTRILCIFTPSLHRQRCTWRCTCFCKCLIITCNFISLNSFLSSLARNTINVISVSSLIQTPVFSMQKRGYFHSSMVYLVFQSGLLCQTDAHWFSNWTVFFVAGTCE